MLSLVGVFSCLPVCSLFKLKRFDCKSVTIRNSSDEVGKKQVQISMKPVRNNLKYSGVRPKHSQLFRLLWDFEYDYQIVTSFREQRI